jgi:D-glycero-D-manno-heptose 1,7-bisphosphate phosphatase
MNPSRPAVFLDRDGTLAHEVGYVNHPSRFRLYPWAADAVRLINRARLLAVVVTNQAGVARGYFPESVVAEVHARLREAMEAGGARLDGI